MGEFSVLCIVQRSNLNLDGFTHVYEERLQDSLSYSQVTLMHKMFKCLYV